MTPGSNQPIGGLVPEVAIDPVIEDRYDWPLGDGVVVRLTFRHVDRLTVEHLEVLAEYLTTFSKVLEPKGG